MEKEIFNSRKNLVEDERITDIYVLPEMKE